MKNNRNHYNKNNIHNVDFLELYSFSIYLHFYGLFFILFFELSFIEFIFINFIGNIGTYYLFNYSVINFLKHSYWKNSLATIAMPQLITCISNFMVFNKYKMITKNYEYTLILPTNFLIFYFIKNIYKKEIDESINLRYFTTTLFFIIKFIFS